MVAMRPPLPNHKVPAEMNALLNNTNRALASAGVAASVYSRRSSKQQRCHSMSSKRSFASAARGLNVQTEDKSSI